MPRANAPNRTLNDVSVGELRRLVHAGLDENLMLADALAALHESDQASAEHELNVRAFEEYRARREERRADALANAAAEADAANRGPRVGDGEKMASRQSARLEADEAFSQREPELDFAEWQRIGQPDTHVVSGVIRRTVETITSVIA